MPLDVVRPAQTRRVLTTVSDYLVPVSVSSRARNQREHRLLSGRPAVEGRLRLIGADQDWPPNDWSCRDLPFTFSPSIRPLYVSTCQSTS